MNIPYFWKSESILIHFNLFSFAETTKIWSGEDRDKIILEEKNIFF